MVGKTVRGPYDGRLMEYVFGPGEHEHHYVSREEHWKVESLTLRRAIRMFRVGVMFPHRYSSGRVKTVVKGADGRDKDRYLASKPGSKVQVRVWDKRHHRVQDTWMDGKPMFRPAGDRSGIIREGDPRNTEPVMKWVAAWAAVAEIDPEDPDSEYRPDMLPAAVHDVTSVPGSDTAAVARATHLTGLAIKTRPEMATETLELERLQAEIEAQRRDLEQQKQELMEKVTAMRAELKKRMEQIWFIELFLGSKEEVKLLRDGDPAPSDTLITVYQRVLCMDEEVAVWTWVHEPGAIGSFDYRDLEDFDTWLLADPAHLELVLPAPKGIRALRVRRNPKYRESYGDFALAMQNMEEEKLDEMVYLLVRNGERVYRLWVDVSVWPRFFPRANEWDWMDERDVTEWGDGHKTDWGKKGSDEDRAESAKTFVAGLVVVQGLILRSDLFDPQPMAEAKLDIFAAGDVEAYFDLVRDDEEAALLTDGSELSRVTWKGYEAWLKEQVKPGVRCFWVKPEHHESLDKRTGIQTVENWPEKLTAYAVDQRERFGYTDNSNFFSFLYQPGDTVIVGASWGWHGEEKARSRRVRFDCDRAELWPAEMISWRVVEHLIQDRAQREHYAGFFGVFARWRGYYLEQRERERPFIDAVLQLGGFANPRLAPVVERARAERLLRWWKMKTKRHRPLSKDEDKAVRMVSRAFKRGDDTDNDPEKQLFEALSCS